MNQYEVNNPGECPPSPFLPNGNSLHITGELNDTASDSESDGGDLQRPQIPTPEARYPEAEVLPDQTEVHVNNAGGECLPSSFLPNDNSLRIKYLEEKEKLWKQLTGELYDRDSKRSSNRNRNCDGEDLQRVQTPSLEERYPEAEAELLPEKVTTASYQATLAISPDNLSIFADNTNIVRHPKNKSVARGRTRKRKKPTETRKKPRPENKSVAEGRTRGRMRPSRVFDKRLEELMEFKRKHGHCNVPYHNPNNYNSLSMWVSRTRRAWRDYETSRTRRACKDYETTDKITASHYTRLDDAKVQRLKEIGFIFETTPFASRIEELKHFKKIHGHFNVKTSSGDFKALGEWCRVLRVSCRQFESGKVPTGMKINKNRLEILRNMGFSWDVKSKVTTFEEWVAKRNGS